MNLVLCNETYVIKKWSLTLSFYAIEEQKTEIHKTNFLVVGDFSRKLNFGFLSFV